MRALWKLFIMVSIASGIQWTISADVQCLADAQLMARVLCARFMGGTGAEPWVRSEAQRMMTRRRLEVWATLPQQERAQYEHDMRIIQSGDVIDIDDYPNAPTDPSMAREPSRPYPHDILESNSPHAGA
jgi:hypothetical protein